MTGALLFAASVNAQLVNDGATNTLSNVTNSFTGDVTVGTNGVFTLLVLSNNALLTNTVNGIIGRNLTAKSNEVRLISSTARWRMANSLFVGSNGSASRLVISNGALLESGSLTIGNHSAGSNNEAIVTGPGSTLNAPGLMFVGADGNANRLTILNGGSVFVTNSGSSAFVGFNQGMRSNSALVADAGSRWSVNNTLVVGQAANASTLIVSNGATVDSANGTIGSALTASNNLVMVAGAGSIWTNGGILRVGDIGPGNQLIASNGGSVLVGGGVYLGFTASFSTSNRVTVDGAGSLLQNPGELRVGGGGAGNRLDIVNGGAVMSGVGIVGNSSSNNLALVTGAGSLWSSATNLIVGFNGSGNSLQVDNGAMVTASNAVLSLNAGANANSALVTGPGSKWLVGDSLLVGSNGASASLVVSNTATVAASNLFVGFQSSSTNNRVTVDGGTLRATNATGTGVLDVRRGTNVLNAGLVDVDFLRMTNTLGKFEFNGGTLVSRGARVGTSANFLVGTSGTNPAVWDVRAGAATYFLAENLIVGDDSSFNQLLITNGAVLTQSLGAYGILGGSAMAGSNIALVSGAGSLWSNGGGISVGVRGAGNQLIVSNAAVVQCNAPSEIGSTSGCSNNVVIVTGAGSVWGNFGHFYVGYSGTGNRLIVTNGGSVVVENGSLFLGITLATNCQVLVDGGSLLVTNLLGTLTLNVSQGTNQLDAGLIAVDFVRVTDTAGEFAFNGGTLQTKAITNGNGRVFVVGDGTHTATLQLRGGTNSFANGLVIANNATLTGTGTIVGTVAVFSGGNLSLGDGINTLVLSNTLSLQGTTSMEIFKNGGTKQNDQIQVASIAIYGGSLTVSNLGPTALAAGDKFKLFSATAYGSSFSPLTLPPLTSGLEWTNKLSVDGSIEVVGAPKFTSIAASGTNVIVTGTNGTAGGNYAVLTATNVALPLSNWASIATNPFNSGGGFSFTNGIAPGELQRYFRLRSP